MNKSMKAALLSALVFPGAGHFYLKKHLVGIILTAAALTSLAVVISQALERAQKIAEKIQSGDIPLDIAMISELVSEPPTGSEANLLNIASAVLIITWLIGIIDAYRIGRATTEVSQDVNS
jgi:hypothetical protein